MFIAAERSQGISDHFFLRQSGQILSNGNAFMTLFILIGELLARITLTY
jgi:hypothetical protein